MIVELTGERVVGAQRVQSAIGTDNVAVERLHHSKDELSHVSNSSSGLVKLPRFDEGVKKLLGAPTMAGPTPRNRA